MEDFKNKVIKEYEKGNIVLASPLDGVKGCSIEEFVKQPIDGMLYDLNRGEIVILTFIDDPKWVNDFASTKLLRYFHKKTQDLGASLITQNKMYNDALEDKALKVNEILELKKILTECLNKVNDSLLYDTIVKAVNK